MQKIRFNSSFKVSFTFDGKIIIPINPKNDKISNQSIPKKISIYPKLILLDSFSKFIQNKESLEKIKQFHKFYFESIERMNLEQFDYLSKTHLDFLDNFVKKIEEKSELNQYFSSIQKIWELLYHFINRENQNEPNSFSTKKISNFLKQRIQKNFQKINHPNYFQKIYHLLITNQFEKACKEAIINQEYQLAILITDYFDNESQKLIANHLNFLEEKQTNPKTKIDDYLLKIYHLLASKKSEKINDLFLTQNVIWEELLAIQIWSSPSNYSISQILSIFVQNYQEFFKKKETQIQTENIEIKLIQILLKKSIDLNDIKPLNNYPNSFIFQLEKCLADNSITFHKKKENQIGNQIAKSARNYLLDLQSLGLWNQSFQLAISLEFHSLIQSMIYWDYSQNFFQIDSHYLKENIESWKKESQKIHQKIQNQKISDLVLSQNLQKSLILNQKNEMNELIILVKKEKTHKFDPLTKLILDYFKLKFDKSIPSPNIELVKEIFNKLKIISTPENDIQKQLCLKLIKDKCIKYCFRNQFQIDKQFISENLIEYLKFQRIKKETWNLF
ncbi:nuclear pore complex protein nup98-nup96 [Anaeramoeba ignava]|uniref:Nuclear pore complex protein nup98-nup96 n=1 Tax=Anaeramoeba ignava TaxID=1746090 RepID=A0A9Q0RED6_ANAIG|nr:nuclear pore complex protein nup98-nup96 [Anaeramoeba ignava]